MSGVGVVVDMNERRKSMNSVRMSGLMSGSLISLAFSPLRRMLKSLGSDCECKEYIIKHWSSNDV